jgi:galactokinase
LDLQDGTVQHWPLPADVSLVVCPTVDPGFEAEAGAAAWPQHFSEAAAALGLSSLRTVDARMLESGRARLTPRQAECLAHWVGEKRRIAAAERALQSGDAASWGALLWQSHESVSAQLRLSTPELDALVAIARQQAGCVGARLTGVGFGGSTLNWVRTPEVPRFIEAVRREYALVRRKVIHPFVCRSVDGAAVVVDGAAGAGS